MLFFCFLPLFYVCLFFSPVLFRAFSWLAAMLCPVCRASWRGLACGLFAAVYERRSFASRFTVYWRVICRLLRCVLPSFPKRCESCWFSACLQRLLCGLFAVVRMCVPRSFGGLWAFCRLWLCRCLVVDWLCGPDGVADVVGWGAVLSFLCKGCGWDIKKKRTV